MQAFDVFLVNPLINLLVAIYQALAHFHILGSLGFSIIFTTILIRLILYPFTVAQIKSSQKMQEMQPHLNRLKEKHKGDHKRLQQEQVALFKQHGVNPIAGCLPSIIQIIFLFGFYSAILKVIALKPLEIASSINKIIYFDYLKINSAWDTNFFGLSLAKTPSDLMPTIGFLIIIIPLLTGILQFIQTKMMIIPKPAATNMAANKPKKGQELDFAQAMQTQMVYMSPLIIGVVSYQFAIGLSLYWNTFTIFGIIQQYQLQGLGGLADLLKKIKWKKQP